MKKYLLLCLAAAALSGCDHRFHYDGDTRYIFEGTITNSDGTPLPGITVSTDADRDGDDNQPAFPQFLNDANQISYAQSDDNGHFRMMLPQPSDANHISVLINRRQDGSAINPGYSSSIVYDIKKENLTDYEAYLGERRLFSEFNTTTLTVNVINIPYDWYNENGINVCRVTPIGLVDNKIEDYNFPVHAYYHEERDGQTATYTFKVARNQVLMLRYRNIYAVATDFTQYTEAAVPVDEEPVTYTIDLQP